MSAPSPARRPVYRDPVALSATARVIKLALARKREAEAKGRDAA